MPVTDAARIHEQLTHPVLDGDGHWVESVPAYAQEPHPPVYVDALGLDNPFDYDALWQKCLDPCNVWAFDARMPGRLKAMLGTDVGHWDVTDFADVIPEVWEMVEEELISERDFRELTFSNAVELHTRMNRDFFKDTVVEDAVERELANTRQEAKYG